MIVRLRLSCVESIHCKTNAKDMDKIYIDILLGANLLLRVCRPNPCSVMNQIDLLAGHVWVATYDYVLEVVC